MPQLIPTGPVNIVSLAAENASHRLGVQPTLPAFQAVIIGAQGANSVVNTHARDINPLTYISVHWQFTLTPAGGQNRFSISVGGYPFIGVVEGTVNATIHQEQKQIWKLNYSEVQDAYT
jgi:hypothetical protein